MGGELFSSAGEIGESGQGFLPEARDEIAGGGKVVDGGAGGSGVAAHGGDVALEARTGGGVLVAKDGFAGSVGAEHVAFAGAAADGRAAGGLPGFQRRVAQHAV